MLEFKTIATGIGSLPYIDVDRAVDMIFRYCPEAPFWPQLPKRDVREGMVAQFSENLPCLKIIPDGLYFDPLNQDSELEVFYEQIIANNIEHFRISPDFAQGAYKFYQRLETGEHKKIQFIKCHITGPWTFAASIKDDKGKALLHNPVFMQVIIKGMIMKALWQVKLFEKFGKKIIVFIDEPYLSGFGSAYSSINREDVVQGLVELTEAIKSDNVLTGVHCCGNTDWSIFTDIKSLDIINFDAFSFFEKIAIYSENLERFLKKGGMLCWGIVPTNSFTVKETADLLTGKIKDDIDILAVKGINRELLNKNILISPACGLGTLNIKNAEKILRVLFETAFSLTTQ